MQRGAGIDLLEILLGDVNVGVHILERGFDVFPGQHRAAEGQRRRRGCLLAGGVGQHRVTPAGEHVVDRQRDNQQHQHVEPDRRQQRAITQCLQLRPAEHHGQRRGATGRVQAVQPVHDKTGQGNRQRGGEERAGDKFKTSDADRRRQHMTADKRPRLRHRGVRRGEQQYRRGAHGGDHERHCAVAQTGTQNTGKQNTDKCRYRGDKLFPVAHGCGHMEQRGNDLFIRHAFWPVGLTCAKGA